MKENYVFKVTDSGLKSVSVCFGIEHGKVTRIGEKMNEIHEDAYMNGYNWEAFLNAYLKATQPALLTGMETDPEAGTYVAYYSLLADNSKKADKLMEVIENLIEKEDRIYKFVASEGTRIEWD